jgi:hypothetical protein
METIGGVFDLEYQLLQKKSMFGMCALLFLSIIDDMIKLEDSQQNPTC